LTTSGGRTQHLDGLAVEEDERAQVDVELHVQPFGLDLRDRRADSDAGVVDEHIEAAEALPVGGHHLSDDRLRGHAAGHRRDLAALA
jgi:hypothetical protein